jgi:quercetin dioxygenase-like cupin family protein
MSQLFVGQNMDHQQLEWLDNVVVSLLLDSEATNGQLMMMRSLRTVGQGAPVHVHENEDEIFLMLAGEAAFWCGDQRHDLGEGGVIFLPRNVPHTFRVLSQSADVLTICTPSGFEDFVRASGHDPAKPGVSTVSDRMAAVAADYGQKILGPLRRD